jgi:hypothetical protein
MCNDLFIPVQARLSLAVTHCGVDVSFNSLELAAAICCGNTLWESDLHGLHRPETHLRLCCWARYKALE